MGSSTRSSEILPDITAIFDVLSALGRSIPGLQHSTADTLRAESSLSLPSGRSRFNPPTSLPSEPLKVYVNAKNVEGCLSVRVSHVDQEAWFRNSKTTEPVDTDIDLTGLGVSEEFAVATSDNPFIEVCPYSRSNLVDRGSANLRNSMCCSVYNTGGVVLSDIAKNVLADS